MASIINSISFNNFFNYYGDFDDTRYEFDEGVNIIVADNGAGKSKFFNAFLWLFYDQFLDSDDKQIKSVKNYAVKIISDKAKNETPIRGQVDCGIRIEYSSIRYKYQITKSFTATKLTDEYSNAESWQIIFNDIEVDQTDHILPRYKPVYNEDDKTRIINRLIGPHLRQYSFFQGEEVDKMIDFNKKSSIEDAVRTLTNLSKYEEIAKLIKKISERAENDLNNQDKSKNEQNKSLETAIKEKERLVQKEEQLKTRLEEWSRQYEEAEQQKNTLEQNFANAEKRKEIDDKISANNKMIKSAKEDYDNFIDGINNRFFDGNFSWISLGFDESIDKFRKTIQIYRQKRYEKKALSEASEKPNEYFALLPVNSPDPVSLDNMIEAEHCYVCNRPAKKHTDAHNYLLKLKDRTKKSSTEKDFVKNNLDEFFGNIQINAAPFYNKLDNIRPSVVKTKEKVESLKIRLDKLVAKHKVLEAQRRDILVSGTEDEKLDNALTIINQYKASIRRMEDANVKIIRLKSDIAKTKSEIKSTDRELKKLRPKDIAEGYIINHEICKDLVDASQNAKNRVFDKMIELLESHANKHFQKLINYSDIKGGILSFEKTPTDGISLDYIDEYGNEVPGASEGFQRMKKFAVVMAIITANTSEYNYPLIADAPISAFGKAFTKGFFESIPDVFPQSIILVKDLYDKEASDKLTDLGHELLKSEHVKSLYVNELDKQLAQAERTTIIEKRK